jgi:hypothetical protein
VSLGKLIGCARRSLGKALQILDFPVLTETARRDIVIVLTRPLVLFDVEYTDRAQIGSGVKAARQHDGAGSVTPAR